MGMDTTNLFRRQLRTAFTALGGVLACASIAYADMGPNFGPRGKVSINLSFRGGRPNGDYKAAVLAPGTSDGSDSEKNRIPGLDKRLAMEGDGPS
jgi:hypothetical protein